MTEKKVEGMFAEGMDLKEFQDIILAYSGWTDTIREVLVTAAKARHNLNTKIFLFWRRISPKYHLDEHKVYDMNAETGEITLSKNQRSKKEVKK